jgi:hypothetical protein
MDHNISFFQIMCQNGWGMGVIVFHSFMWNVATTSKATETILKGAYLLQLDRRHN